MAVDSTLRLAVVMLSISHSTVDYNVSTTQVFVWYKMVLYLTKTFVVKPLYYRNLLCCVKCSTSLLTDT